MKKILLPICLFTTFSFSSCSDFLSEYSQDMIVAKTVTDLDEVLLGEVYVGSQPMPNGPSGIRTCGFFNIIDDDVNTGKGKSQDDKPQPSWISCLYSNFGYFGWQFDVGQNFDHSIVTGDEITWNDMYHRINVINIILDEITDLPHTSENDEAAYWRVQGEAHFLRAWFYFVLANLYGDAYSPQTCATKLCVPLKLSAAVEHDKDKDTQFQRATVKEVYAQIIDDLTFAEQYLSKSPQKKNHRLHRATLEAVQLLFSRVSLYMQDWVTAEKKADAVINSNLATFSTLGSFGEGAFLTAENPEVIFSQGSNYLATNRILSGLSGDFCVAKELYDLYSENDYRRDKFFNISATDSIALAAKYERGTDFRPHISDVFTLRIAEAYLNKMEACAMQSGKENTASDLLNKFRRQRIESYSNESYSGIVLVEQIRQERRKELCFEGHRWFDLRRYAANEQYPYTKNIVHVFNVYNDNGFSYARTYVLNENDPAYTFALPKAVVKFDKIPMEDNPREDRKPVKADEEEDKDEGGKEPPFE